MHRVRALIVAMVQEEFRLQARLYGGPRFGAFPLVIGFLVAGGVWAVIATGTPIGDVIIGLHLLVLGFGVYTGSVGLVGQDALRGLLGELTLVLQTARTLPIGPRTVLGVFVFKDIGYYTALFLLPIAVGVAPAGLLLADLGVGGLLWLFIALVATFSFGLGVTLLGIALAVRGRWVRMMGIACVVVLSGVVVWRPPGINPIALSPYAIFAAPLSGGAIVGGILAVGLPVLGIAIVDPYAERSARRAGPQFKRWVHRFHDPLLVKTLLDTHRSGGGFWKVAFSAAVILGVAVFLVDTAATITGRTPAFHVAVGTLLGLSGLTSFAWVTQFDTVDTYRTLPVRTGTLFVAKLRSVTLLTPPVLIGGLVVAWLYRPGPVESSVVGALLGVGVGTYLVGTVAYLGGLRPTEHLFDPVVYVAFTVATAIVLVPLLILALVAAPLGIITLVGLGATGGLLAVAGTVLYARAATRWRRRYRAGAF